MIPALLSIEDALRAAGMVPGVELPPAPPEYVGPSLIPAPAPDFRMRLASALDGAPAYSGARPGESAASAGLRGLLSGASGGFVASQEKRAKVDEANRVQSNTASRTAADRAYANAQATWREKLTRYYRTESDNAGKVMLTPKMAEDMGIPFEAGRRVDPVEASKAITARRNSMKVPKVTEPKPPKSPKGPTSAETRRQYVSGIIADLARSGLRTRLDVADYLKRPGVVDTLAAHGIMPADIMRGLPE